MRAILILICYLLLLDIQLFPNLVQPTHAVSISLNNNWILKNGERDIEIPNISLPSGIFSALEESNITESIFFSKNDVKLREFSYSNWSYSLNFNVTSADKEHQTILLTFHGLDTISEIFLNNESIGTTKNMFVRYRFDVRDCLIVGENHLVVHFQSPVKVARRISDGLEYKIPPECPPIMYNGECHMNLLRKMQASFAWDWGLAAPSMGIWKNVELEMYDSLNIRDITYELSKISEPPFEDDDGSVVAEEDWIIKIRIFIESGLTNKHFKGALIYELAEISGPFTHYQTIETDENGESVLNVTIRIKTTDVKSWWPNGYGDQNLYELKVKWEDERANEVSYFSKFYYVSEKKIRIGFRTIELVQETMNNGLSFYFRVNGIPIFMKGSNWIPASILPEKTAENNKINELLQAVKDANMNMLRVWGGGVYESDYFYNLADEYGILIWQDLMFACAMYPANNDFLNSVRIELKHQIRRIQYHPSIALFATNNENEVALRQGWYGTTMNYSTFARDYKKLYVDTITKELLSIDKVRPILTSSPSNGAYDKDRDSYGISFNPQNNHFGDIHFYPIGTNSWLPQTFHQARFASEYGFQSFPQGWKDVVRKDENILELINHRQHHPLKNSLIIELVNANLKVDFSLLDWEEQVYLSQLSQAMALKAETEVYRSGRGNFINTMGSLYWQLNDVWTAPSWSSIEFNGNFKIIQHWIAQIFAPLSIIAHVNSMNKLIVYGVSDEINVDIKKMILKMNIYKWNSFDAVDIVEWKFDMKPNAITEITSLDIFKYLHDKSFDVRECFMLFYLYNDHYNINELTTRNAVATNFVFPGTYKGLKLIRDPNIQYNLISNKCDQGKHQISIEIRIDAPAIFIYIVLDHDNIKKYRLSKNGFIQVSPIQNVEMTFENAECQWNVTNQNLKFKTLNKYLT